VSRQVLARANGDDPGIPVADAIELLRDELEAALEKGAGRSVQFGVSDVTLTVNVVAGKSKDATGKIRWWVIEAGGSGTWSREVTQTLVLTLHPERVKPDGTRIPLDVGAEDSEAPTPGLGGGG
jgi:Trypsin-co-occurring domain 2